MSLVATGLAILLQATHSFECLPQNETKTIYYENYPDVEALLPTVRLVEGWYDSQYAMQYAASIYLKEVIGVNVSFYPFDDPGAITNFSKQGLLGKGYPFFYWQWIADDKYDLCLESWEICEQQVDGASFYRNQTVLYGGSSNVFAEQTFFVPSYVFDDHPTWILPHYLVHDNATREAYINATVYGSERDWVNYSIVTNASVAGGYSAPSYTRPVVWGSLASYSISGAAQAKVDNLLEGTWDFVPLGSESKLSELVKDLYLKKLPFVATIYDPHADFSTVINETTGERMTFQTIAMPRNPSNSDQDECVINGMCGSAKSSLIKMGNPHLRERFPEMINFLHAFKMTTSEVNFIIMEHIAAANMNLTEHEKWQYAACQWVKNATTPIEKNTGKITRYLCAEGVSQFECVQQAESLSSLEVIIFGLSGFISFVLIVWIVYKVAKTCKEYQDGFVSTTNDQKDRMLAKERRRIIISIITSSGAVVVSLADFASDAAALVVIMMHRAKYTEAFMVTYFVLTILASIVSTAHILATLQTVISDGWMLKSNKGLIDELGGSQRPSQVVPEMKDVKPLKAPKREKRRDSVTQDGNVAIAKLKFKKKIITKKIKEQTSAIFVGLVEDIPFYIMNMIALLGDVNSSGEDNAMFLISLSITAMSVGFKISIGREMFSNLGDKGDINEQIASFEKIKRKHSMRMSMFEQASVIPLDEEDEVLGGAEQ